MSVPPANERRKSIDDQSKPSKVAGSGGLHSRRGLVFASAALFLGVVAYYAGPQWPTILLMLCTDGAVAIAWTVSAAMLGSAILRWCRFDVHGSLRIATAAGLGLGIYSLAALGLGLLGALNFATTMAMMIVAVAIGAGSIRTTHRALRSGPVLPRFNEWLGKPARGAWLWLIAVPFLAMGVLGSCTFPGWLWRPDDPHPYDVLVYHLQVPREWYEAGRITPLLHNVYSFFPFNMEMHFLCAMHLRGGPWAGMYTAQFMSLCFAVLGVLAVHGGRNKAAENLDMSGIVPLRSVPLSGVMVSVLPWTLMVACVAYVESGLVLYTALALIWVMRGMREGGSRGDFLLAGAFAGLACGVKFTAVPMLLIAAPVAVVLVALARRWLQGDSELPIGVRRALVGSVLFGLIGLATLSPWLIRNAIWTGNPIFPLEMNVLGHGHYTPEQVERFDRAHRAPPQQQSTPARLTAAFKEIVVNWKYGYVLWPMALGAVALNFRRDPQSWMLIVVMAIMLVCWLTMTHLMSRFFVMAIPAAALLIGRCRWSRFPPVAMLLIAASAIFSLVSIPNQPSTTDSLGDGLGVQIYGIRDLRLLVPPLIDDLNKSGATVVMVGDSQAFLHEMTMKRLRYRTVFDVNAKSSDDIIQGWEGDRPIDAEGKDVYLYIDPSEHARLSKFYGIPLLPPGLQRGEPFAIKKP